MEGVSVLYAVFDASGKTWRPFRTELEAPGAAIRDAVARERPREALGDPLDRFLADCNALLDGTCAGCGGPGGDSANSIGLAAVAEGEATAAKFAYLHFRAYYCGEKPFCEAVATRTAKDELAALFDGSGKGHSKQKTEVRVRVQMLGPRMPGDEHYRILTAFKGTALVPVDVVGGGTPTSAPALNRARQWWAPKPISFRTRPSGAAATGSAALADAMGRPRISRPWA
ncbi:hypothetical protein DFJ74DRAFT_401304 [Hyaloraphidium curvatum]|nr:hypothetical protein DFJ74DRAFT_401304 [Hyaloraphidium curvatum]